MKKFILNRKRGFTLIELLVTIAIIGLLSLVIGWSVVGLIKKGEESSNKVTYSSIKNAALDYVSEFKTGESDWYSDIKENGDTEQFTCTTIQQLINKGFLKSGGVFVNESGNEIDKDSLIKVVRDKNKVVYNDIYSGSNAVGCDRTKPELEINLEGNTTSFDGNEWYIESPVITLIANKVGMSGVYEYIFYVDELSKNIETSNLSSSLNADQISSDISNQNVNICGVVINKNCISSDKVCKSINIDTTIPSNPILVASDNISSDNWHKSSFDLNVSGGNSPSGIYYKYILNNNETENIISNKKISNINSENDTYKVKTCNNVGRCSSETTYIAKVDDDKPNIISFVKNTEETALSLTLSAKFKDNLSGVVKYKINKSSSYVNSGWNITAANTNEINYTLDINQNSKYYLWVEDAVGNYTSKLLEVTNIDKEAPVYKSGGLVSISGSTGSISTAVFDDVSLPVTVYYLVNTTGVTPSSSSFTSTSRTFSTSCGNTYYAYAKAIDRLGNYTIKYLGSKSSSACCDEGTYTYYDCTSNGYKRNRRYNNCLSKYEYQTTTTACSSECYDYSNWGDCQSSGERYRTCYYYYGGVSKTKEETETCTYQPEEVDPFCSYYPTCSQNGYSGGFCWPLDMEGTGYFAICYGYPYWCSSCYYE